MADRILKALVLAGGRSRRMGDDKAAIVFEGETLLQRTVRLASAVGAEVFVGVSPDNANDEVRSLFNQLVDSRPGTGPLAGILTALESDPEADWLVLACDMPGLDVEALNVLLNTACEYPESPAVALRDPCGDLPEPLCAVWRGSMRELIVEALDADRRCARKCLINAQAELVAAPTQAAIANMNTPDDRAFWQRKLA